jgi:site-specific recombinase XerD
MKMKKSSGSHVDSIFDIDQLIKNFGQYLLNARGLAPRTINEYCKDTEYFLHTLSKGNKINICHIHPKDIIQFILESSRNKSASRVQHFTYPLRSFFRFLTQTQQLKEDLANFVPTVANRKKSSYPQVLLPNEITKLLQSCDRHQPAGIRSFAILMLMVNLGLRSSEVCNLKLKDINWDKGEIVIRGKGGEARFPIFKELGKALVAYLKRGRPICECKHFFIRLVQPLHGFTSSCVRAILRSVLKQAGLNPKIKGAHLLRHSFATQLLEQGASLEEIGMVLRHKDVGTTAVYARANFDKLRTIALPWPQHVKKEASHD